MMSAQLSASRRSTFWLNCLALIAIGLAIAAVSWTNAAASAPKAQRKVLLAPAAGTRPNNVGDSGLTRAKGALSDSPVTVKTKAAQAPPVR